MLTFHLVCLSITLYVMGHYVISGFHSKSHRLLPLVLGLVAVYNFYLIVEQVVGQREVFLILKALLLMQVIFLLMYYIMDFMKVKAPVYCNVLLFIMLVTVDAFVCTKLTNGEKYQNIVIGFSILVVALSLVVATYAYFKIQVSRVEHSTYIMLYISILIPCIAFVPSVLGICPEQVIMPLALAFACIILDYLMTCGTLMDTEGILKSDIYNSSEMAIFLFDKGLFYLDSNLAAKEQFSDIINEIKGKKQGHVYMNYFRSLIDKEEGEELAYNGKYYICVMRKMYLRNQIKGYIMQIYDISEQKAQVKDKSSFMANMSHDLRSPLHAIIGGSEIMLSHSDLSGRNRVLSQHIKDAGENLLDIVNQILDYSKLESGKLTLSEKEYNFKKLLIEQKHIVDVNLMGRPIDFKMEIMTDYPEILFGDELRVREILQNLLSNAVKYTEQGSINCRIWCEEYGESTLVKVEVEDTGSGINKEKQEEIFKEFATYTNGRVKESTGLGLSIVLQLSEMMGGKVKVESDGESGTKMIVTFYQKTVSDCLIPHQEIEDVRINDTLSEWNKNVAPEWIYPDAKILVADDLEVNRQIIREYAIPWEVHIDVVENGLMAIEAIKKEEYQLVILDLMMPVMDGVEAAHEIRKIADLPIISLSANEQQDDIFDDFIQKPIQTGKIKEIIEGYIPEKYRKNPPVDASRMLIPGGNTTMDSYIRTLNTYVKETGAIMEELWNLYNNDLDSFRVKVHGIKGTSRQLNRKYLGDMAEIMEMAAKAGHTQYIERHLDDFIKDIEVELEEASQEIDSYNNHNSSSRRIKRRNNKKIPELKEQIRRGFLEYNIQMVEKATEILEGYNLNQEERDQIVRVKEACADFDYDLGAAIFEEAQQTEKA